jgi:hypothetical protein
MAASARTGIDIRVHVCKTTHLTSSTFRDVRCTHDTRTRSRRHRLGHCHRRWWRRRRVFPRHSSFGTHTVHVCVFVCACVHTLLQSTHIAPYVRDASRPKSAPHNRHCVSPLPTVRRRSVSSRSISILHACTSGNTSNIPDPFLLPFATILRTIQHSLYVTLFIVTDPWLL